MTSVPWATRELHRSGREPAASAGKNSYALYAVQESFAAGAELGQHAAGDDGAFGHLGDLIDGEPSEDFAVRAFDAGNVGEEDERVGVAGDGAGGGHFVGVDVVVLAVEAESHGGEDGHAVQLPDGFEPARIAGGDLADKAEVGRGALFAGAEEQAVAAGEADGGLAERAERGDQALVHLAGEDHQRDVAGFGVGDAQAVDELALLAQGLEHAGQLHAAAVDDGDLIAVAHELGDGARAALEQRWSFKARTTEFDDVLHSRPSGRVSFKTFRFGQPSITFMFCTACPDAPFNKLSRQLTMTARRPSAAI